MSIRVWGWLYHTDARRRHVSKTMKIGIHVPQWGATANRADVLAVARLAEAAGLDSVWVADHIVYPLGSTSTYPGGSAPFAAEDGFLEAFTTLAAIAGATERIGLGTSVVVLPMREPLQVAKTVATLDVLSGGRMSLGVGAGWWAEEFDALGAPFERRGRRLDEQVSVLRALWRGGAVSHRGEFYDFDELVCEPVPLQVGGPPLLIGGLSPAARRRAGLIGDGWHASGSHAPTLIKGISDVRRIAREASRDDARMLFSTVADLPTEPDGARRRLLRLQELGLDHVVLSLPGNSLDETRAGIEQLAVTILPELRAA
jgi:probable F420-dependent oxidoreductase